MKKRAENKATVVFLEKYLTKINILKQDISERIINEKNIESKIFSPVINAKVLKKNAPPIELEPG